MGDLARDDPNAHRWRIEALYRQGDETVEDVLARRFDATKRRHPDAPVGADEHRWMDRVVAVARGVRRDFLVVVDPPDEGGHSPRIQLLDERASVTLEVRPDTVRVIPLTDYEGDGASGFALMWELCQALERDANCVIVDPIGIAVIEMQLDAGHAREEYGWI